MKIHLSASGFELTSELEKYANTKVAQLVRQVPRKLRPTAVCKIHFTQKLPPKAVAMNTCSITFSLDAAELKAEETTQHMYVALDIAAVHIAHQLADYATKQRKEHLRSRLKRRFRNDE